MARKRYKHDFVDGQLVTDTGIGETIVFMNSRDGRRAEIAPEKMRPATPAECEKFRADEIAAAGKRTKRKK